MKPFKQSIFKLTTLSAFIINPVMAADFTIVNGEVNTTPQTLNDNESGRIEVGGQLNTATTAINAIGESNIVNNSGNISVSGGTQYGVNATGINVLINNSGNISTTAIDARAIVSLGNNPTIINSGNIFTTGLGARGIYSNGANSNIYNSGIISTTGDNAHNVVLGALAINSTIINSGNILSTGRGVRALYSIGQNTIIINSGYISSLGDLSIGMQTNQTGTLINRGYITSFGNNAHGIYITGGNANIVNSGQISTTGVASAGLYVLGTSKSIINSGSILTTGSNAQGIFASNANDLIITNSGNISTKLGNAIELLGANNTINNSGSISATGAGTFAIRGNNNSITLNLFRGSTVIGDIDLGNAGGDNDVVNIVGNNVSSTMTFQNTEAVNLLDGASGVVITNGANRVVTTTDSTGESTRGVALANFTGALHNVIGQRIRSDATLTQVKIASLELSPSMMITENKPVSWVQPFGGRLNRDNDGNALAYKHTHSGINFGYEQDFDEVRIGFLGGYARTNTDTDINSFKTKANNFFVGAYSSQKLGSVRLTASLLGGYSQYDNKRLVIDNSFGRQLATSDFNSVFISPSVTMASAFKVSNIVELRPSATLSYSMAWLDGYTEKGTTNSNLKVGSRQAKALSARAQLEGAYSFNKVSEVALRVGVNSRHTDDDQANISLAGNRFNFTNSGDDNVTAGFVGAHLRAITTNQLNVIADLELGSASKENYATGYVSLEYLF